MQVTAIENAAGNVGSLKRSDPRSAKNRNNNKARPSYENNVIRKAKRS